MPALSYCLTVASLLRVLRFMPPSPVCYSASVQVKFSQPSVTTTEEEGQASITVRAMGDLSFDFSIIVKAVNGTAVGKLFGQNHSSVNL